MIAATFPLGQPVLSTEGAPFAIAASLSALTASIAHEVNQPLSGIITNVSTCLRLLAADPPNVEGANEAARRAIRDGNRASDMIAGLRTLFTRSDPANESFDLNDAALEMIALSLNELHGSRVLVRQQFAHDLSPVNGDRVQIQQVIMNFLRNALDAMKGIEDRPRELTISTERHGDRVCLHVRDSGTGFVEGFANKLFEAFYTTKNGGMGIGLFVSRSIIEKHCGRIWATRNDGPGATFSFSVPCGTEGVEAHGSLM